uniref:Uncharacterized protein n=1 Tax=Grammatophora oceanica TaxID=210454 RepID=A0A7S1VP63_9STRA
MSALENDSKGKSSSHEESRSSSGISHGTDSSDTISDGEEEDHPGEESPNVKRVARLPFFRPHLLFKSASERSRSRRSVAELKHDSAAQPSCEQATSERRSGRRFVNLQTMTKDYSKWQRGTGAADATTVNRSSLEEISFASGSFHGEDVEVIDLASGERVQKRASSARRVVDDESPEQTRRRFVSLQNVSKGYSKWQRGARSKNGDEEPRFALEEISFANGSLHGEDSAIIDLAPLGERATPEQNNDEGVIDGLSQGSLSYLTIVP